MERDTRVLCLGVPDPGARRAVEAAAGSLGVTYLEDADPAQRQDLLRAAPAVFVWSAYMDAEMIHAASGAVLIQRMGEGLDHLDLEAARQAGVPVARATGINATSTAELHLLLLLAVLRQLPAAHRSMTEGRWDKWSAREGTRELRGKLVGIVGLGKIGSLVSRYVAALGAEVRYVKRTRLTAEEEQELGIGYLPLGELVARSDVVSIHLPLSESTRGLIGRAEIAAMKPSAILVNTARGQVVDEDALVEALMRGRIAGAGLDVYAQEPLPAGHPLRSLDNVVLTPHVGGVTEDSRDRLLDRVFHNIRTALGGGELDPQDVVLPGVERLRR